MNVPPEIVLQIVSYYCKRVISVPTYQHENVLMWCDKCNAKHHERIKVETGVAKHVIAGDLATAKALREVSTSFAHAFGIEYMIENIGCDFGRGEYARVMRINAHFAQKCLIDFWSRSKADMLRQLQSARGVISPVKVRKPLDGKNINGGLRLGARLTSRFALGREIGFGKTFSRSTITAMYPESMQPSGRVNFAPANFTRTDEDQSRYLWDIETYSDDRQISYSDLSRQHFPQILLVSHRPARPDSAPQQLAPPANQRLAPALAPRSKKYPRIRSKRLNKQSGRRR
jgi:hypothetical protein